MTRTNQSEISGDFIKHLKTRATKTLKGVADSSEGSLKKTDKKLTFNSIVASGKPPGGRKAESGGGLMLYPMSTISSTTVT
jgi:hypothetical protein